MPSSSSSSNVQQLTQQEMTRSRSHTSSSGGSRGNKKLDSYIMREVILKRSSNQNKKYDAYVEGKKINFGAKGYSNMTQQGGREKAKIHRQT